MKSIKLFRFKSVIFLTLLFSSVSFASIRVFPVSLKLTKKNRSAQLTVRHSFADPRWIEVSSVFFQMNKSGDLQELSYEDGVKAPDSAMRMVRFSPKRFLLKPGESQIIRVRVSTPAGGDDKVFRAHLKFTPEEPEDKIAASGKVSDKVQYQLKARVAMAIPIYIGESKSEITLSNLSVTPAKDGFDFHLDLNQKNGLLTRGDFEIFVEDKKDAKKRVLVGKVVGLASYIETREVKFELFDEYKKFAADHGKRIVAEFKENGVEAPKVLATISKDL